MASGLSKSLTGVWHGLYTYLSHPWMPESHFTATLIDSGGYVSGTIHEVMNAEDGISHPANAHVAGHYDSGQISFTKTYDGGHGQNHSVAYAGHTNDDISEIEGGWQIDMPPFQVSGRFLMIRYRPEAKAEVAKIAQEVD